MIYKQSSRILHHTLTNPAEFSFTVPISEDPTTWTPYDLGLSEIGVDEARGKVYMRIGSNIVQLTGEPQISNSLNMTVVGATLSETTTIYSYDLSASEDLMVRFDTYASFYTIENYSYNWHHTAVVRKVGETYQIVSQYYSSEDLDGQSTDIDFKAELTGTTVSFGLVVGSGAQEGDLLSRTTILKK